LKPDVLKPDVLKPDVLWVYRLITPEREILLSIPVYCLGMCPLSPINQNLSDFLREENDFEPFLFAIFKTTRRKPGHLPEPARLVSDSGIKAAPSEDLGTEDVLYVYC
jgi:hypothetical protein